MSHPSSIHWRIRPQWIALLLIACVASGASHAWGDAALDGTNPAQWRVVWHDDPATAATVSWTTAEAGRDHRVRIRAADGDEERTVEAARSGRYTGGIPVLFFHHARLRDLKPGTKYFVTIESDGRRSPEMYFVTAPEKDVPIVLLFGGDSRSGRNSRRDVNKMMAEMVGKRREILALAHGGDFVLSGFILKQWSHWLSDHELTTAADGRMLPIIPTRGNHDGGELFNQIFDFPDSDKNYYAVNVGPEVRLLTLNSNVATGGDQAEWLDKDLAASRQKFRWLVAQYHRPAFPAVKSPGSPRTDWVPLFEKHDLDLACEADGHCIKRTPPIRNNKLDPTGVVYIGEGGLGVKQRTPLIDDPARWYLRPPGKTGSGHHVQVLTFGPKSIDYEAILLGGETFDRYTIPQRSQKAENR